MNIEEAIELVRKPLGPLGASVDEAMAKLLVSETDKSYKHGRADGLTEAAEIAKPKFFSRSSYVRNKILEARDKL